MGSKKASEFIDSLLRGLPVPAFFLYEDAEDNNKKLIVDGQQRLLSLYRYIREGLFNDKTFGLTGNVHREWKSRTFKQLESDTQKRLEKTLVNCTVMRQITPDDNNSSMYLIFQRINTGGISLKAQEIRMSMSYGSFSKLLANLAENSVFNQWGFLRQKKEILNNDYHRIQELILRFFALYLEIDNYSGNMRGFLDNFFAKNRRLASNSKKNSMYDEETLKNIFNTALNSMDILTFEDFAPAKTPTLLFFEAVWIGLTHRVLKLKKNINKKNLRSYVQQWKNHGDEGYKSQFNEAFHSKRTTSKESVKLRIDLAKEYFSRDF